MKQKRLADAGVKELLVVSQDTSAYAMDTQRKEGGVKTAFGMVCQLKMT